MSLRRTLVSLSALVALLMAAPAAAHAASFTDIDGHFHAPSIEALASESVVNGCTDERFCPERHLTRAQLASMLSRALELPEPTPLESTNFTDIDGNTHETGIRSLEAAGLTRGCQADRFCPNDRITRAELATMLDRALEFDTAPNETFFSDVGGTHRPGIDALAHNGVAAGCSLIAFCPSATLTRAHAATFVARGMELVDRIDLAPYAERRAEHDRQVAEERERRRAEAEAQAAAPGQKAAQVALDQVGKPYQWGGNGPNSFDCSGLTSFAWRAAGVEIPRTSRDQHRAATSISRSQLRPGDLVFYHSPVSHVAMYIGDGKVVEAPYSGNTVRVSSTGLSRSGIVGYGRFS